MTNNPAKRLIEEFGVKKEIIALRLRVSIRSVERWRDGEVEPHPGFREQLVEMIEKIETKKEKERAAS